jgi:hypothetical protein
MRQLICERLDSKTVINVRYRSQPSDADVCLGGSILYPKIRNIVRNVGPYTEEPRLGSLTGKEETLLGLSELPD